MALRITYPLLYSVAPLKRPGCDASVTSRTDLHSPSSLITPYNTRRVESVLLNSRDLRKQARISLKLPPFSKDLHKPAPLGASCNPHTNRRRWQQTTTRPLAVFSVCCLHTPPWVVSLHGTTTISRDDPPSCNASGRIGPHNQPAHPHWAAGGTPHTRPWPEWVPVPAALSSTPFPFSDSVKPNPKN